MSVPLVGLTILAYLLGSVTPAYLAARLARGIDLRKCGTGSTGLSNLWHATGKRVAIVVPVVLFDLAKGMPLVWVAKVMGLGITAQVAVALAVIIGHNWPLYLGFRGGRGMLTTLGIAIILPVVNTLSPWPVLVGVSIAALGAFVVRNSPLGVVIAVASLPLVSWIVGEPPTMTLGYLGITLVMVIRRLALPRNEVSASLSLWQLLLNRLLFDRDIRDRAAWLSRPSSRAGTTKGEED